MKYDKVRDDKIISWGSIRALTYLSATAIAFGFWQHSTAAGATLWLGAFAYMAIRVG